MKSARLLALLLRLQASGRVSAGRLARELEVSERTVYRDVEALSQAGVPIYAERGTRGGIELSSGYRNALTQLSAQDLQTLLVMSADPLADLGLGDRRSRVAQQMLAALPEAERALALRTRQRVLVDSKRWYQDEQPTDVLRALREAAWADLRVELTYRDRSGAHSVRTIEPLGLVSKAGVWYVVARTLEGNRTFRIDRIANVVLRDDRFERPTDFDLDAYWHASTERVEATASNYWITLRVAPHAFDDLCRSCEHEVLDRLACTVRIKLGSASEAAWRHFGWSESAHVLDPPEFIAALVRNAQSILARYGAATGAE